MSGSYSLIAVSGLLIVVVSLRRTGLGHTGFSSCSARARPLWCVGLVPAQRVGSSQVRDQSCVSCVGRGFFTTEPPGKPTLEL